MVIRVRKQDSAYFYQILESYEGLANPSTLEFVKECPYRDIILHVAPDLVPELKRMLNWIRTELELELL